MSPESREVDLESCRAVFYAIKATGAPVQLLLSGCRSSGMLFDTFITEDEALDLKRNIDFQAWYLHRIGDLVNDLRIMWGANAPEYCSELGYLEELEEGREYEIWQLEREKERLTDLWRDFANIFPELTRLKLYIPSDLYPAKDDDDFINTILPGKGWTVKRRKDEFNSYDDRTYFSRTFVRTDAGAELDFIVTSTAALEL